LNNLQHLYFWCFRPVVIIF